jgi:TPR repeat protein
MESAEGCYYLAAALEGGWGVEKNAERAATLMRRACNGHSERACKLAR